MPRSGLTTYQPLVDFLAVQTAREVTLSFTTIEAIVGRPLAETMQVDTWQWKSMRVGLVWRLAARGWQARLDRRNRCVHFTRDAEDGSDGRA